MQEDIKPLNTDNAKVADGVKVRPQDPVTVVSTGKTKQFKAGDEYVVHSALASKLVEAGKATLKGEKGAKAK